MVLNTFLNRNIKITSIDDINKFLLLSSLQNFNIKKIKFKFFSNDFLPFSALNDDNTMSKINSLTAAYFLLSIFPSITYIKKKIMKKMDTTAKEDSFILDIEISKKSDLYTFISKLMLEQEFFENNLNVDQISNIVIEKSGIINYNTKISTNQNFEQQEFFSVNNIDCNLANISMSTNFIFHQISKKFKNNIEVKDMLFYKMQYL